MSCKLVVVNQRGIKIMLILECPRCDGKGRLEAFSHIRSGLCFLCAGAKTVNLSDKIKTSKDERTVTYKKGETEYRERNSKTGLVKWKTDYYEYIRIDWGSKNEGENTSDLVINDGNREHLRSVWSWLKQNNFKMIIEPYEKSRTELMIFDENGKPY